MTRGNINYVWQEQGHAPMVLWFYWNGDQYPTGVRDYHGMLELVKKGRPTKEQFIAWAKANYENIEIEDLGEGGQPKVYYTDGFITDYSYSFDSHGVHVWNYAELIFDGSYEDFYKWLKNYTKEDYALQDTVSDLQKKVQDEIINRKVKAKKSDKTAV